MKKLEIRVERPGYSLNRFKEVFKELSEGRDVQSEEYIAVSTIEELNRLLSPKRLQMLNYLKRHQVRSISELAEKLKRDYKNVYSDLKLFEELGIVKLEKKNGSTVPYVVYDELDIKIPLYTTP
ncbi:HVO_A0114 family putative DNA-binding protein [Persephonella sp.]